ncbi:autotransporter secretion outer membrane protein TamA [Pseudomonas chlororaphis]|jgi:translocation and assembly module TamA|uniref:autotransporter assembly complex protein TamA n=1 Tax=Pseudomonas chlororaphis TaxID=587753 RepID=UPI00087B6AF1|nr:autotransporter assembly complex family protein [Pseudomonas chlororaphis]AZD68144.1 Outer membrane component of TAM transport system [Pseudomonas chlororaphis subsp. aurantiaca]QIT24061.1 outer membrane protein assembly factor [Pseudomonas chlororaphis subsp. aurantiaca]WDH02169.1 autotransporter assembly complex protein TamA [Pseudomonas chlororaphis]WDH08983.1 autotransporter assembly complex protein TamA [Pseudomonas chlororaphis]SDS78121.1 autotransporter secretion outer membrane prote
MKFSGRFTSGLLLLFTSCAALAQSELDVRVKPSNDELKANVEGYIGGVGDRDEEALLRFSRGAEEQARKAAQALGYYQPQISSEVKGGEKPRLVLNIDPGEPVHLRNVTIRVDGPAASLKGFRVPKSDQLKSGAVLNHGHYEDAKRLIQNQASRYGFFSGRFTRQKLAVDPQAGVADIELVYESGPRYALGKVSFAGDTPFDEDLLQRMVPFKAGTPYDSELIAELNQALQSSGYFEGVRVDAAPTAAAAEVIPVAVQLETRKPRTMGLGLGFSTDVGPRAKANWTRHWVNAQGHSYGWEAEISAPRQNVGLFYDIPLDPPLTDKLRFAGGYQNEEISNTDTLSKLLTLGPEWHSKLPSGWQRVISLKWQREEYRLGDDSGLSNLLMPGISYSYLRSDNRIDPHNGYRLQFDSKVAKEGLGSDTNLLYGTVLLKGLTTVWDNHRFLGRVQFGGSATNGYKKVPPSLRFFAGGDQSVRGYDYQSLSPENSDGDRIGGRYMVAGSVEYQYSIAEKWRLATFVDQGNSFDKLELPNLKTGVGVGVRWISPVGPIRLDLARALDDDGGIRLHFSMGPEL